jgi:hypothetical protein
LAVKKLLIITGVGGLLITVAVIVMGARSPLLSTARQAWKEMAIAEISSRVADPAWEGREMAELKKRATGDARESEGWLSERLIVMRNGEWLAYANVCRKENSGIHDLVLGRGSDGRWYYSTYHFCKGMIVLRMEDESESLATFARDYYLRPFDGHSDECLQKTWPPNFR